jgi:excisionase family DNA binding protein
VTPEYLTVAQAAARLAVTPRTVRRAVARGEIPALRIGAAIRIHPSAIAPPAAMQPAPAPAWRWGEIELPKGYRRIGR